MATLSLSPSPVPTAAMSSRRAPLASNPNAANSPLRAGQSSFALHGKLKRNFASLQSEDKQSQVPAAKRQTVERNSQRSQTTPSSRPSKTTTASAPVKAASVKERHGSRQAAGHGDPQTEHARIDEWKQATKLRFPQFVFYFDNVPGDTHVRFVQQMRRFGAREEKFFSNVVTHVVTTRAIPPAGKVVVEEEHDAGHDGHDGQDGHDAAAQPRTINPSLLDMTLESRRKMLLDMGTRRNTTQAQDATVKRPRVAKNMDVLSKAQSMEKKIWTADKFHRILSVLTEDSGDAASKPRNPVARGTGRVGDDRESKLIQMLQHEQINGPTDRDPTVSTRELSYFKGPHIYVYDIDERQKPIMVREYPKVANKSDGEWPQFRSVTNGRCPFVEDADPADRGASRQKAAKPTVAKIKEHEPVPVLRPTGEAKVKPETRKRTLAEMEDGHNKASRLMQDKPTATRAFDHRLQAFTSRGAAGPLVRGEPVASGLQPSNVTSAIKSQMISSASGLNGAKAGTSKEIHGLQRKVLQKTAIPSHDASSKRLAELSIDALSSKQSTFSRATSRAREIIEEEPAREKAVSTHTRSHTIPHMAQKSKRDPRPGYCENCQEKYADFDDHIVSRRHRRFAENNNNWLELDSLLKMLDRPSRFPSLRIDEDELCQ